MSTSYNWSLKLTFLLDQFSFLMPVEVVLEGIFVRNLAGMHRYVVLWHPRIPIPFEPSEAEAL